jgi:hypothetical protein
MFFTTYPLRSPYTYEAEYITIATAACHGVWMAWFLAELKVAGQCHH